MITLWPKPKSQNKGNVFMLITPLPAPHKTGNFAEIAFFIPTISPWCELEIHI